MLEVTLFIIDGTTASSDYLVDQNKKKTVENKFNSNFKQWILFVILLLLKDKINDLVSF